MNVCIFVDTIQSALHSRDGMVDICVVEAISGSGRFKIIKEALLLLVAMMVEQVVLFFGGRWWFFIVVVVGGGNDDRRIYGGW